LFLTIRWCLRIPNFLKIHWSLRIPNCHLIQNYHSNLKIRREDLELLEVLEVLSAQ
jgi:hypothetical protein